jgi:hypothetical protein
MAEIICIECKEHVSDALGYCPNCGFPFDLEPVEQMQAAAVETQATEQTMIESPSLDVVMRSLDAIRLEMNGLQRAVADLKQDVSAQTVQSRDGNQQLLTEVVHKLDTLASIT